MNSLVNTDEFCSIKNQRKRLKKSNQDFKTRNVYPSKGCNMTNMYMSQNFSLF